MLTLGILLITIITCIVIVHKYDSELAAVIGGASSLCLVFCALTLININSRFQVTIEKYNNLKEEIEEYNSLTDSCKNVSFEFDTIKRNAVRMNNTISKHSVMSKSAWVNLWYSEKIGNLEKLNINGIKE